jgi:hypothetical protein
MAQLRSRLAVPQMADERIFSTHEMLESRAAERPDVSH